MEKIKDTKLAGRMIVLGFAVALVVAPVLALTSRQKIEPIIETVSVTEEISEPEVAGATKTKPAKSAAAKPAPVEQVFVPQIETPTTVAKKKPAAQKVAGPSENVSGDTMPSDDSLGMMLCITPYDEFGEPTTEEDRYIYDEDGNLIVIAPFCPEWPDDTNECDLLTMTEETEVTIGGCGWGEEPIEDDGTIGGDVPVEDVPVEDIPIEEVPVDDVPVEEVPEELNEVEGAL